MFDRRSVKLMFSFQKFSLDLQHCLRPLATLSRVGLRLLAHLPGHPKATFASTDIRLKDATEKDDKKKLLRENPQEQER